VNYKYYISYVNWVSISIDQIVTIACGCSVAYKVIYNLNDPNFIAKRGGYEALDVQFHSVFLRLQNGKQAFFSAHIDMICRKISSFQISTMVIR
jgi:hypothetical protein